jgi:hypothetical protein
MAVIDQPYAITPEVLMRDDDMPGSGQRLVLALNATAGPRHENQAEYAKPLWHGHVSC